MNTTNAVRRTGVNKNTNVKMLVQIAMLSAVAAVLMLVEFPLPFLAPSFYQLDFSEVPVLIGAFAMGPLAGAAIELVKILMNFVLNGTVTAGIGGAGKLSDGGRACGAGRNDLSKSKKQKICDDWYGDTNGLHGGGSSGIKCLFAPSWLRKSFWHAGDLLWIWERCSFLRLTIYLPFACFLFFPSIC